MNCPKCGKKVYNIQTSELQNYDVFLVHGIDFYRGTKIKFKESQGCYITQKELVALLNEDETARH